MQACEFDFWYLRRGMDLQDAMRLQGNPNTWVDVRWQPGPACLVLAFKVPKPNPPWHQSCTGAPACVRGWHKLAVAGPTCSPSVTQATAHVSVGSQCRHPSSVHSYAFLCSVKITSCSSGR